MPAGQLSGCNLVRGNNGPEGKENTPSWLSLVVVSFHHSHRRLHSEPIGYE
jgi:hypothetical protein